MWLGSMKCDEGCLSKELVDCFFHPSIPSICIISHETSNARK
ncbi:hypothetical protein MPTK1_6g15770 [Marchantia polymorpha subsp. ruderalis]|uniref:Uncharacterized protein n=2 Tax=Marchantia polymorpha TaxID=3197 RepID=A0AAF6BSH1_MARPO|nr:hypothetical protein MARPO_0056s0089 [Marchantia polymorpha]BBN14955.1 hypothetical protein Mp_6g15770 [Marchantia polymorpha subsp. ruderalis]|eukprot:PTQ37639.1 hypothetical protein MARPO_0056s0089 [Marchantia polymorpha]